MRASADVPTQLLRQAGDEPAHALVSEATPEPELARGRRLACVSCRRRITTDAARIAVSGRHDHTFANPRGYVYRIGCFALATGLILVGPMSSEFTWFPGYSWQIQQCAGCSAHLGWLFRAPEHAFHGLILDSLVDIEDEA